MRYSNWPIRLNEYIASISEKTFEYGTFDCCTFTAGAVEAITGIDHVEEFRDTYDDKESSKATMKKNGKGNIYRILQNKFGKPVHGAMGRKGDIAYYEGNCGIVLGIQSLFIGEGGFTLVPISKVQRAFRVK